MCCIPARTNFVLFFRKKHTFAKKMFKKGPLASIVFYRFYNSITIVSINTIVIVFLRLKKDTRVPLGPLIARIFDLRLPISTQEKSVSNRTLGPIGSRRSKIRAIRGPSVKKIRAIKGWYPILRPHLRDL